MAMETEWNGMKSNNDYHFLVCFHHTKEMKLNTKIYFIDYTHNNYMHIK